MNENITLYRNGKRRVAVPSTAHADHLIQAKLGGQVKIYKEGINQNNEVFNFLSSVCNKYGIGFWKPGGVSYIK